MCKYYHPFALAPRSCAGSGTKREMNKRFASKLMKPYSLNCPRILFLNKVMPYHFRTRDTWPTPFQRQCKLMPSGQHPYHGPCTESLLRPCTWATHRTYKSYLAEMPRTMQSFGNCQEMATDNTTASISFFKVPSPRSINNRVALVAQKCTNYRYRYYGTWRCWNSDMGHSICHPSKTPRKQ